MLAGVAACSSHPTATVWVLAAGRDQSSAQQTRDESPPGLATGWPLTPPTTHQGKRQGVLSWGLWTQSRRRSLQHARPHEPPRDEGKRRRDEKQKADFESTHESPRLTTRRHGRSSRKTSTFTKRIPVSKHSVLTPGLITLHSTSVEILPKEWQSADTNPHAPFEFNEGHLGIPKHIFMQVYSYASKHFFDLDLDSPLELDCISSLVLLVNPAHQTALNRRKDLVLSGYLSNADDELRLTAVLQSLPDGAKSSILWHHRRWVLNHFHPPVSNAHSVPDSLSCVSLPLHQFAAELEVASIACETYPRNYHAWLHKSKVIEALAASHKTSANTESETLLRTVEDSSVKHVDTHIKDYSSMHYISRVFDATMKCGLKDQLRFDEMKERPYQPVEHAKGLLHVYPTYESLWYYLRAAILIERNLGVQTDVTSLSWLPQSKDPTVEKYKNAFVGWVKLACL